MVAVDRGVVVGRDDVAADGPGSCGAGRGKMDLGRIFEPTYLDHSNLLLQLEYVLYIKIHIE